MGHIVFPRGTNLTDKKGQGKRKNSARRAATPASKKTGAPVDPHAQREAAKYDNPIPSREVILELMAEAAAPLDFDAIASALSLSGEAPLEALRRRLGAMQRDGQVMMNRRGLFALAARMEMRRCKVIGHREGYGFAKPEEGGDDLYLSNRQMQQVFDGDIVLAATVGLDNRGRPEGKVVEILSRAHTDIVGRYMEESGIGYLLPHNNRISQHILISPAKKGGAKNGQVVSAHITDYPTRNLGAKGEVTEILGDHLDPGLEIDIAIRAHGIPCEWPDAVLAESATLRDEPDEHDKLGRVDLRNKAFITIDGEDARDFDDAVYCEREGRGFRLWVAIADVSHYVAVNSALDKEAIERGNSVYFPERVVPMFPEVLSNGLCSLKPKVDRLAMVCELQVSDRGELLDYQFYEGLIYSHARLTYTQVGEVLAEGWHEDVDGARLDDITRLHQLYTVLRGARDRRGAIDFETVETRIIFNEARKIEAIVPVVRNDAHKIVEECMLIANVATAQFLDSVELPALFRVHEGPSASRLENLRKFLGELALDLPGGEAPTPSNYQQVLSQIEGREDASIIQTMMLRSLSQAVYSPDNAGHFGLHYPAYAHFTSPIRRYPDLLVHRALRHLIRSSTDTQHVLRVPGVLPIEKSVIYPYQNKDMDQLGEHCSITERRADDATREVEAWLKCEYLRDKVGEVYQGVIGAVTSFGIFVELIDLYIEGLVHISALPGDYYHFDQAKQRLVGERTRRTFQLGGSVTVKVARVDLDERKIDLELEEPSRDDAVTGRGALTQPGGEKKRTARGRQRGGANDGKPAKHDKKSSASKAGGAKARVAKAGAANKGGGKSDGAKTATAKKRKPAKKRT